MDTKNHSKKILISGAGISGLTLAYYLHQYGFKVVIVEKSEHLRNDGKMIAFFSSGVQVADDMNLLRKLKSINHSIIRMKQYDIRGNLSLDLDISALRAFLGGKFFNFLRSDLVDLLYSSIPSSVDIRFSNVIDQLENVENGCQVTFSTGTTECFDLVLCAEGANSRLRNKIFDKKNILIKHLNHYACVFTHSAKLDTISSDEVLCYQSPGKLLMTYKLDSMNCGLAIFKKRNKDIENSGISLIRNAFGGFCKSLNAIVDSIIIDESLYIGEELQVFMNSWHKGRVCFVGDSAYCPSLVSGQGASLAMSGAYILAKEIGANPANYTNAYNNYESEFRPVVVNVQRQAAKNLKAYIPDSAVGLWVRNKVSPILFSKMFVPLIKNLTKFDDNIVKPIADEF